MASRSSKMSAAVPASGYKFRQAAEIRSPLVEPSSGRFREIDEYNSGKSRSGGGNVGVRSCI